MATLLGPVANRCQLPSIPKETNAQVELTTRLLAERTLAEVRLIVSVKNSGYDGRRGNIFLPPLQQKVTDSELKSFAPQKLQSLSFHVIQIGVTKVGLAKFSHQQDLRRIGFISLSISSSESEGPTGIERDWRRVLSRRSPVEYRKLKPSSR